MKIALITGGFKRIGAAIATRLANEGWALALHYHNDATPEPELALALASNATLWQGFQVELSDGQAVEALLPAIIAHFDVAPTLLINCASRFVYDDPQSVTADTLATHLAVNMSAPVLLSTALAKALPEDSLACIINILDQRIAQPNGDYLSYLLAKQGLAAATNTLARALAPGIRVNAVAPGLTLPTDAYRPAQMVALADAMPLKTLPEPDDIVDAVMWLAGAKATTGQTVFVDGGASLKSYERDFQFMDE